MTRSMIDGTTAGAPATPGRQSEDPGEERALIESIRRGDRMAAERMVELTYQSIYASLFRLCGDRDRAADLTQETYRKAWQAFGRFDGRSRIFTWLYRIAYTTFLNAIRDTKRTDSMDAETESKIEDPVEPADRIAARHQEEERVRREVRASGQSPDDGERPLFR